MATMHALVFRRFGGPEVLEYAEVPRPSLIPGHALVRMRAIGLNFADVYRRKGNYHLKGSPPYIAGYEGAGVVEQVDATGSAELAALFAVGARVGFADVPFANAEYVLAPLDHLIPLPDDISFETAAGVLLQGLTAQYLVYDSHPVKRTDTVVVHAAAGGVGQLLCQMAKDLGAARVIGLTSSADKKRVALTQSKCDDVFLYEEDWVTGVQSRSIGGTGADVIYDSVGSTLGDSLRATRPCGHAVFYGMAGGDPKPVDPRYLMDESKTLTGGDLWSYLTTHAERMRRASLVFELLRSGRVSFSIAASFPLSHGAKAHEALESRQVAGKILLLP
eukprot:Opistho-1_new@2292